MNNKIFLIYKKLYMHFGPQHWWPGDTPFEVIVGAILTQNTSWSNVEKAIASLKNHKLLKPHRLYKLSSKRLASLIKPAGYYNIKAKRLKNFLRFLSVNYEGKIGKMSKEKTQALRSRLLAVNGIGPETADSILLYALGKKIFVIDAYTKRILTRHGLIGEDAGYDEAQSLFMRHLPSRADIFNEYHALLVRLGKDFCLKNRPRCEECPIGKEQFAVHSS